MRLTRLYLRNYRVYEQELDLELPPGLIGIYGVNGAGKSYLIESILWTLFGRTRTTKDEVRTSGVLADCVTEVEFEHEGHLYAVRRTLSGINATVRAEATADGAQVADGVTDTRRYVQSVLGMDDAAFRASVFAEQKQVSAFSNHTAAERRKLVLGLLGITPLDDARDAARKDARERGRQHEQLRAMLPDVELARTEAEHAQAVAAAKDAEAVAEQQVADTAAERRTAAEAAFERLDAVAREHAALLAEGRGLRAEHDATVERVERLAEELAALAAEEAKVAALAAEAEGADALDRRLALVRDALAAAAALASLPQPADVPPPDDAAVESAAAALAAARERVASLEGELGAARRAVEQAAREVAKAAALEPGADCPTCGQELGDAFEQVQAHRAAEQLAAERAVRDLERAAAEAVGEAQRAQAVHDQAVAALREARRAWDATQQVRARREAAEQRYADAVAVLGAPPEPGEDERLADELARRRAAATHLAQVTARLERRPTLERDIENERLRLADSEGRLQALRDKVRGLAFDQAALDAARAARDDARAAAERAAKTASELALRAAELRSTAAAAAAKAEAAADQHAKLAELEGEVRHLARTAQLLDAFRTTVVGTVGPRLAAQAAELFGELTDQEYDRLEVDPETYELQIRDAGHVYGLDRFSGSETDLANLALRVAISEHVRFQSGGAVGLLVLDEVFGPLDDDRRERMLLALERLRARFRQVMVVTHANDIKEQLPNAIEVVKLPGRRATARVLTGG